MLNPLFSFYTHFRQRTVKEIILFPSNFKNSHDSVEKDKGCFPSIPSVNILL